MQVRRSSHRQQTAQDPDIEGDDAAEHPAMHSKFGLEVGKVSFEIPDFPFQSVEPTLQPLEPLIEPVEPMRKAFQPTVQAGDLCLHLGEVPFMSREGSRGAQASSSGTPAFSNES
jgi:hypothetical protein